LASVIIEAVQKNDMKILERDVFAVTQKVVSKAEGRVVKLSSVHPSKNARDLAASLEKDPRLIELVLREAKRIVRIGHGVLITETRHGFICANSGVDQSNVRNGFVTLLPKDPDITARRIRDSLERVFQRKLAVVITDTFGRPWREGQVNYAIGCSGIQPLLNYVGKVDRYGYKLRVTQPATVDEIAAAAGLVMEKMAMVPVAILRGARYRRGHSGVTHLLRARGRDLFR
jgi:coenzyme F420-0:L-glutamate ligase/coenzyme F420-1:gamma-L-glutamate ligase